MTSKINIMSHLLKAVITAVLLLPLINASAQPTAEIANGSPYGVFVISGMDVIPQDRSAGITTGYLIERKGKQENEWHELALVPAPVKLKEFENRLKSWCERLPEWANYDKIPAEDLFKRLTRTGRIDSLKFWAQVLPVRLAAGTMFLDSTMTDTLQYQYRISAVRSAAAPQQLYVSNFAKRESSATFGDMKVVRKLVNEKEVIMTYAQDPGFKPVFYRVFRKDDDQRSFNRITPVMVRYSRADTSFLMIRDTVIVPGRIYSYYVQPVDYYGKTGSKSEIIRTGIYDFSSIKPPHNIITRAVKPAGGIQLGWKLDAPKEIKCIDIYRSMDYDTGYVLLTRRASSDTLFTDASAEPMKKYFYYFVMEGFFGEKSEPGVRVFGIAENGIPPQRPVISRAESIKNGVKLEINIYNYDIKGVRIYRLTKGQEEFSLVANLPAVMGAPVIYTDTSKFFTGYTLLSYKAQAENSSYSLSDFSDTISVHPLSDIVPEAPDNLELSLLYGNVHLIWDDVYGANPNILGYNVYRRKLDNATTKLIAFELISDGFMKPEVNYFNDTLAAEGSTYEYQVKCVDFYGTESRKGPVAVIKVPVSKAIAPGGMTLFTGAEGITIEWEEPLQNGAVSYRVYRYERGTRPVLVATVKTGTNQYTDTTAKKETLYFYYLTTIHKNGTESTPGKEEGVWKY